MKEANPSKSNDRKTRITMILLFCVFSLLGTLLIAPCAVFQKRRSRIDSWLLPFSHVPALFTVAVLISNEVGNPASLGNIIEFLYVTAEAVVLACVKVFVVDRLVPKPAVTTFIVVAILVLLAVVVRLTIGTLQE